MKFYSTNNKNHQVSLKDAVIKGLAPDQGLYMPIEIPAMDPAFIDQLHTLSFKEIGYEVIKAFFKEDLTEDEIKSLVDHTLTFDAPLKEVEKELTALELFKGPPRPFNDLGAGFSPKL